MLAQRSDQRTDQDQKNMLSALQQDAATESYRVTVSVQGAIATLTGTVSSYYEKQLVAFIVKGVKGVRELRNDIKISYSVKRTDSEIEADIKSRLQSGAARILLACVQPIDPDDFRAHVRKQHCRERSRSDADHLYYPQAVEWACHVVLPKEEMSQKARVATPTGRNT